MGSIRKSSFGNKAAATAGREASIRNVSKNAPKEKTNSLASKAKVGKSIEVVNIRGQRVTAHAELPKGVQADAYAEGPSLRMTGSASAQARSFKSVDLAVNLNIDAKAVKAGASVSKTFDVVVDGEKYSVKVKLGPDGYVGANGTLNLRLKVGPTGVRVQLGASGFVGARGALTGTVDVAMNGKRLVSSQARVTFSAGVGAGASLDVGPGRFEAKAYAVAGVGVGFEMKGAVNSKNLLTSLPEFLPGQYEERVKNEIADAKDLFNDAKRDTVDAAKDVASRARGTAIHTVGTAKQVAGRAKERASDGFETAKNLASRANPFD